MSEIPAFAITCISGFLSGAFFTSAVLRVADGHVGTALWRSCIGAYILYLTWRAA